MIYAYAAILFAVGFAFLLVLLHFLKPELNPVWRMISEYEIGRHGWLMQIAFFCWGASLLSLLVVLWPYLGSAAGSISRWWLLLISAALAGAGIFKTNSITDNANNANPNPANTLHALCGAFVILTFPVAAALAACSLLHSGPWIPFASQLTFLTVLAWAGVILYFSSIVISRKLDPAAGRAGPKVYQGWPNRFMVFTYIYWIIILAINTVRILKA
jgi:hypothetical protein